MPIMFYNGKILFTDSGAVAMDPACCCTATTTTGLICAGGTEPSIVLTITAPDGDLPISWCGKTWVKSTETPGVDEAYSGQPQEVCPVFYTKGVTSGSLTVNHIHRWANNNGVGLEMFRRYLSYYSSFSAFFTNVNFLALAGLGATVKDVFAKSWQTTYATATVIDSTFNIGLISAEPLPQKTAYTLTNGFFGSYTTGNVTYAWAMGTNWA